MNISFEDRHGASVPKSQRSFNGNYRFVLGLDGNGTKSRNNRVVALPETNEVVYDI